MRIDCDQNSPCFWLRWMEPDPGPRIFVDGVEVRRVTVADEEAGEVRFYEDGADGRAVVDPFTGDLVTKTVHGKVEIWGKRRELPWPS